MKQSKISRRSFLLGLGAVSAAAVLTACGGSSSASTAASGSAVSGSSVVYRTLDQIKESGTINIGVFSDKNPFGYVDENGEYQGYDVYFARRLGEDLGVEINFVSTEAANRIEYLQTGKADVILANFTVTPERAEEVDFALPYMNVALGVISPDSNVITTLDNWNADDQMIVIVEAGVPERRLIAFQTIVLRNQRLQATHIGDTCASGLNQSGGGVVADLELVRFHARDFAKRVGGIHQHQWRLGQRGRHMGDAVRHLGVQKAVGAVSLECGDFLALAVLAVGAHGDEHIAELACSGLRAQNHTAGVRGGGHLLTDETEDVRPACTQRTGQRIRLVAELGGDGAHIVRNFGLYAPLVASVEHQRYRRDGNPRLVRDFLHRNHASNDTP